MAVVMRFENGDIAMYDGATCLGCKAKDEEIDVLKAKAKTRQKYIDGLRAEIKDLKAEVEKLKYQYVKDQAQIEGLIAWNIHYDKTTKEQRLQFAALEHDYNDLAKIALDLRAENNRIRSVETFDAWHTRKYGDPWGQRLNDVLNRIGEYITDMVSAQR